MIPFMDHRQAAHTFVLRPIPPFRLDLTVWALRRRPRNLIDRWDGTTYRRVIVMEGRPTELAVRQAGSSAAPRLIVTATPPPRTLLGKRHARSVLDQLLGLRIDLTDWYHTAAGDARLRPLADTFRGMKPPRFPTMFEALVNAFACQQLSLEVGLELLNRLATITQREIRNADATPATPSPPRTTWRGCRRNSTGQLGSAIRRSARFSASPARSCDGNWIWSPSRGKTILWCDSVCSNCAASAGGRPSTCCCEASGACTCSPAMMWALRSDWLDGLGVHDRWTTPACAERSNGGSRTPAWCISTSCSTGCRRPAP